MSLLIGLGTLENGRLGSWKRERKNTKTEMTNPVAFSVWYLPILEDDIDEGRG